MGADDAALSSVCHYSSFFLLTGVAGPAPSFALYVSHLPPVAGKQGQTHIQVIRQLFPLLSEDILITGQSGSKPR